MGTIGRGGVVMAETTGARTWYLNSYHCDRCDISWDDEWDCMCNDRCPECNRETEPHDSIILEE